MGGEKFRLFGVGAEARHHGEDEPVGPGRGEHLVVGGGDVRPHPLAVSHYQRPAVAASGGHRGGIGCRRPVRRGGFGDRRGLDPVAAALP
jgi:hypothetical protein